MAKSQLPKWINPTGDDYWDGYYMMVSPAFYGCLFLIFFIIGAATYNTFLR